MRKGLLKFLWCPECHSELSLLASGIDSEIIEGNLVCYKCRKDYPIVRGIPRFTNTESYSESFGYEWRYLNWIREDDEREFWTITDWKSEDLSGKKVLEVGCGGGRLARFVSNYCNEFVGFDYSLAVDKAQEMCKGNPKAHFVQCDVNKHPFRPNMFDTVYSHGVIHHTPDTKKSFDNIPQLVKYGGTMYIAIFPKSFFLVEKIDDLMRSMIHNFSPKAIAKICEVMSGLSYRILYPKSRDILTYTLFDWYAPKYHKRHSVQEVMQWFKDAGFSAKYINASYAYSAERDKYKIPSTNSWHVWALLGVIGIKQ